MITDENAFCRARQLVSTHSASLSLVHVPSSTIRSETLRLLRDELRREATAKLGDQAAAFQLAILVAKGYPADVILASAESPAADLIVLGDHKGLRMRDRIFGTTGTQVIRGAQCPVLIARQKSSVPYERVMAAVADIGSAEHVLATTSLFEAIRHLTVVHVAAEIDETPPGLLAEPVAMYRRSLQDYVSRLTERHPSIDVTMEIEPAPEGALRHLTERWAQLSPDLVVIGTRRHRPLARWFTGSYAETALLECSNDVLIVPTELENVP